jgi:CBS domain-containing protein
MYLADTPLAPAWSTTLRARDVMTGRIVNCDPDTPREHVARLMAEERIHCVVVSGVARATDRLVWGVATDADLLRAALAGDSSLAGQLARTEMVTVQADAPVPDVARVLLEHEVAHALVLAGERPVGVVSSLDLVEAMAR